jgi:hypothetical protein
MEETRNAHRISVRKSYEKKSLGRPMLRWEDNISSDIYTNRL